MLATALSAQDNKQTFTRKVVIEQFTTAQCGWCPSGAERITSAAGTSNNIIWIKHHAGFGTDDLTNDIAETLTCFYGGSTFAPAMMVDRTRFNNADAGPVGSVGNASEIRSVLSAAKSVPTYCKIYTPEVGFDPSSRQLTCTVSGRFGDKVYTDNTRLVVFLVEDSIFMQQHDYVNGASSNGYAVDYWHMGTVRDTISTLWGDPLTIDENNDYAFSQTYTYTLPDDYVYRHCYAVAIIYNYDPNNINNCPVLNSAKSDFFDQHLGIGEMASGCEMRLYPNPATNHVVVESDADIEHIYISNTLGQQVSSIACHSQQQAVNISTLANGTYIIRIQTAKGMATRRLVVTQ